MAEQHAHLSVALQGRYAIERELGRGGMATVYLALDLKLQRKVALKLLHAELGPALGADRFLREIQVASRLNHPHILALHDSGEADGRLFYAMPYVEGESLRQRLDREPQLPVDEAVAIVQAVAAGLDHAHTHGVVHRDIKPENILLVREPSGRLPHALVADFGIARALDVAGGERLTETGLALGTPAYMSPEQASPGGHIDGRGDVYSLGCVAYEMLAGAPPFTGPTAQAVMARHAVDPVPPLRTVRAGVPEHIEQAIARALAKAPADRFSSAADFAAALTTTDDLRPRPHRTPPLLRRGLIVGALAALAGVVVAPLAIRERSSRAVLPSAATVAVLPFWAPEGDTALARLGRDLAITVGASLDGVGGITTTDRLRLAHETEERPVHTPEEAAAMTRRLGAQSALLGTTVREGERVRLDLSLYQAADWTPIARSITIIGHRDSVAALTDSVVWGVLRKVWQRGEPPTPSLTAVTTRSMVALRAFLDGEQRLEKDEWESALLAYRSAIAADSTFWLAYFRYSLAQYWWGDQSEHLGGEALHQHRDVLPERDRLLVEAWSIDDSLQLELDEYREITRRFPDYWPAWFILGDRLWHVGILLGYDWRDAQFALKQAVTLNPRLKPAWGHLFGNSIGKDTIESEQALPHLAEPHFRLLDLIARSDGVIGPEAQVLADSLAKAKARDPAGTAPASWGLLWWGFPAAQVDFNQRVLRAGTSRRSEASHLRGIAWGWAARGAWDSALAAIRQSVLIEPNPPTAGGPTALDEYGLAALGAWLGAMDPAEAVTRRPAAAAIIGRVADDTARTEFQARLAWLDGIVAFARGDTAALRQAREEAGRSGYSHAVVIQRSLASLTHALAGRRTRAGRELAAMEWRCANRWDCGGLYPATPNIAIHRLASATWLLEAGDTAEAVRLLTWHEAAIGGWDWSFTYAVTAPAYLMLARIEEATGDTRSAVDHYWQFLRRYDTPMPAQRHLVDEARAALARLAGRGDPPPGP